MKLNTFILFIFLLFASHLKANEEEIFRAEEISYEWLVKMGEKTGETDHIFFFKKIFDRMKVKTLLEFGPSYATKYFLDSCSKVISIEFITLGYGPDKLKSLLSLYRNYSNWIPVSYFSGWPGDKSWAPYCFVGSDKLYAAASYHTATCQNYALIDDSYLKELETFIVNLTKSNQIDVAFVDSYGAYMRGDFVQILFGKVPIILAHDTNRAAFQGKDLFAYTHIITPKDYEKIYFSEGNGTTIWIKKSDSLVALTEELQHLAGVK